MSKLEAYKKSYNDIMDLKDSVIAAKDELLKGAVKLIIERNARILEKEIAIVAIGKGAFRLITENNARLLEKHVALMVLQASYDNVMKNLEARFILETFEMILRKPGQTRKQNWLIYLNNNPEFHEKLCVFDAKRDWALEAHRIYASLSKFIHDKPLNFQDGTFMIRLEAGFCPAWAHFLRVVAYQRYGEGLLISVKDIV